jgi:hypothetical protein
MDKVSIKTIDGVEIKFNFCLYLNHMIGLVPLSDISFLKKIAIQKKAHKKSKLINENTQAFYYQDNSYGYIEIILENIIDVSIPLYAFEKYPEIGGLLLSEIVFHEIGHHVHYLKRHGIKKKDYETFADKYAEVGYKKYLLSRASKILSSYRRASFNFFLFNKKERKLFSTSRQELTTYLSHINNEIDFP